MTVTINPTVRQPVECEHVELSQILARFKSHDKNGIEKLRSMESKDEQNKAKVELPVVVFGGKFTKRSNEGLVEASGLMILDFDCESESESESIRDLLEADEYILSYFRSTRGMGWKALVRIPVVSDDKEYKEYWNAVQNHFPQVDPACKDIARACFFTYDPELVYKPEAKIWDTKESDKLRRVKKSPGRSTDYAIINKALNVIRRATDGEKHRKTLAAARLCGGWVASGKIDYQEAERLLTQEVRYCDFGDLKTKEKAISDGLEHGMRDPIDEEKFFKEERIEEKFDKIYWTLDEIWEKVEKAYDNGLEDGYTTGYLPVDELYRLHLGYTTYLYGAAFSGKSQVWFDFLKNYSHRHGLKHVIFSPETGDPKDVYTKLIEMEVGKDFYENHGYRMTKDELRSAKDFIDQHFLVIDPEAESMSLDDMIDACEMIERVFNTKIHTVTIDPWNDLYHDMSDDNFRDDKYLEKALRKVRITAHLNNWHICLITHTRDQAFIGEGVKRYQPPATFREIAGGQAWSRRGFMMASVWRPPSWMEEYNSETLEGNETFWIQQKYKPEWAGEKGIAMLRYRPQKHCYYTGKMGIERYADLTPQNEAQQEYSKEKEFERTEMQQAADNLYG